ncbi:hypothetical protein D3C75_1167630 [compost metagenome]
MLEMLGGIVFFQCLSACPTLKKYEGTRLFQIAVQIILQVTQFLAAWIDNRMHYIADGGHKLGFSP